MSSQTAPNYPLRIVLALFGVAVILLGLNVSLGGMLTLGWQGGSAPFLTVTDPAVFAVRDSHIRFIGGVWLGVGAVMLAGSIVFQPLRPVLTALTAMIFLGGLARFSSGGPDLWLSPSVGPSLLLELAAMPLLALFIFRAER